jgi:hypothetical protein
MPTLEDFFCEHKTSYRRLNSIGHFPGCVCDKCFVLIERAIRRYLPGLLPDVLADPRILELEMITCKQREEIHRLRTELDCRAPMKAQGPTEKRGLDVDPR